MLLGAYWRTVTCEPVRDGATQEAGEGWVGVTMEVRAFVADNEIAVTLLLVCSGARALRVVLRVLLTGKFSAVGRIAQTRLAMGRFGVASGVAL